MKVLIVDDDRGRATGLIDYISLNVGSSLERIDFAASSDEAKRSLQAIYYDAVVIDVVLPKRGDEKPSPEVGVALVSQIFRGRGIKRPEKLIAITAHEGDIEAFRSQFEEYCTAVVRAAAPSDEWRRRITDSIKYVATSKVARESAKGRTVVFTVHGIRTYGQWQNRLRSLVLREMEDVEFQSYKYGYFSALAFIIPRIRDDEVKRMRDRVLSLFDDVPKKVVIFSHSFGTYLSAGVLKAIVASLPEEVDVTLVLSGSVLGEDYDWSFMHRRPLSRVINDCGSKDYILSVASASVLGVGMAGKVGFSGFNGERVFNRWFIGGHSHYFRGDEFMRNYWVPVVVGGRACCVDMRGEPVFHDALVDGLARTLSRVKSSVYVLLTLGSIAAIAYMVFKPG